MISSCFNEKIDIQTIEKVLAALSKNTSAGPLFRQGYTKNEVHQVLYKLVIGTLEKNASSSYITRGSDRSGLVQINERYTLANTKTRLICIVSAITNSILKMSTDPVVEKMQRDNFPNPTGVFRQENAILIGNVVSDIIGLTIDESKFDQSQLGIFRIIFKK